MGLMDRYDGLELSPRRVEFLKYLAEKDETLKVTDIAARFSIDPSTVTKALHELQEMGFVIHEPYRGVRLSSFGSRYGEFLLKRHRILGLILSHYGLSEDEACREASRFESYVSRHAINKMCRAMGHPTTGICGAITHDELCHGITIKSGTVPKKHWKE
jgi:DtxR family Mn-dependent transcriptional regulator